jgi:hypothetical protein
MKKFLSILMDLYLILSLLFFLFFFCSKWAMESECGQIKTPKIVVLSNGFIGFEPLGWINNKYLIERWNEF